MNFFMMTPAKTLRDRIAVSNFLDSLYSLGLYDMDIKEFTTEDGIPYGYAMKARGTLPANWWTYALNIRSDG